MDVTIGQWQKETGDRPLPPLWEPAHDHDHGWGDLDVERLPDLPPPSGDVQLTRGVDIFGGAGVRLGWWRLDDEETVEDVLEECRRDDHVVWADCCLYRTEGGDKNKGSSMRMRAASLYEMFWGYRYLKALFPRPCFVWWTGWKRRCGYDYLITGLPGGIKLRVEVKVAMGGWSQKTGKMEAGWELNADRRIRVAVQADVLKSPVDERPQRMLMPISGAVTPGDPFRIENDVPVNVWMVNLDMLDFWNQAHTRGWNRLHNYTGGNRPTLQMWVNVDHPAVEDVQHLKSTMGETGWSFPQLTERST